jgi:hypothetical protein
MHAHAATTDRVPPAGVLAKGRFVPRGWTFWGHCIEELGKLIWDGDDCYVPVRYTNGEYAVVKMRGKMRMNGIIVFYLSEIKSSEKAYTRAIRHSSSMPEIIRIDSHWYVIGISEGDVDLKILISRDGKGTDTSVPA